MSKDLWPRTPIRDLRLFYKTVQHIFLTHIRIFIWGCSDSFRVLRQSLCGEFKIVSSSSHDMAQMGREHHHHVHWVDAVETSSSSINLVIYYSRWSSDLLWSSLSWRWSCWLNAVDAAGTNYRQALRPRPGSPLAKVQPPLSSLSWLWSSWSASLWLWSAWSAYCPIGQPAAQSKHRWMPVPRSEVKKVKLKGKFGTRFQVGSKVGTGCRCEFCQFRRRGVFGFCFPRDSYFEFGSLGTHWPLACHIDISHPPVLGWEAGELPNYFPKCKWITFCMFLCCVWVWISCNSWRSNGCTRITFGCDQFRSIPRSMWMRTT